MYNEKNNSDKKYTEEDLKKLLHKASERTKAALKAQEEEIDRLNTKCENLEITNRDLERELQEKNIKEVIIIAEEKVKLNFIDVLVIVTTFGLIFFIGMFSTVMSNWEIFLISIPLCCSIYCIIRMLNNKLAQTYYEGCIDIIKAIEEYEKKL